MRENEAVPRNGSSGILFIYHDQTNLALSFSILDEDV